MFGLSDESDDLPSEPGDLNSAGGKASDVSTSIDITARGVSTSIDTIARGAVTSVDTTQETRDRNVIRLAPEIKNLGSCLSIISIYCMNTNT